MFMAAQDYIDILDLRQRIGHILIILLRILRSKARMRKYYDNIRALLLQLRGLSGYVRYNVLSLEDTGIAFCLGGQLRNRLADNSDSQNRLSAGFGCKRSGNDHILSERMLSRPGVCHIGHDRLLNQPGRMKLIHYVIISIIEIMVSKSNGIIADHCHCLIDRLQNLRILGNDILRRDIIEHIPEIEGQVIPLSGFQPCFLNHGVEP